MKRVLTALALIPIVVWVVVFANFWVFFGVLTAVALVALAALLVLLMRH